MADTEKYAAEMFSGEQITEALAKLSDWDRYDDIVTLKGSTYSPGVLKAFAALADALKLEVTVSYNMVIRTEKPLAERRASALRRLRGQAEKGEIQPAYMAEEQFGEDDSRD